MILIKKKTLPQNLNKTGERNLNNQSMINIFNKKSFNKKLFNPMEMLEKKTKDFWKTVIRIINTKLKIN